MERIESRNNQTLKWAASLTTKKGRESEQLFCFEGVHLLEEYLRWGNTPTALLVRQDAFDKYSSLIKAAGGKLYLLSPSAYEKITQEKAPQGIFTVSQRLNNVVPLNQQTQVQIKGNGLLLADLQDNGNVGTAIRTAASLDCSILLCGNCADVYSAKTVRATMGALFSADVYLSPSAQEAVELLRANGRRVIATALNGNSRTLGSFEIAKTDCFVIGNEGNGLPEAVINKCDFTTIIPMSGKTESLNAAAASAILLWEAKRGGFNA